jgi:hypothetical protein
MENKMKSGGFEDQQLLLRQTTDFPENDRPKHFNIFPKKISRI